MDNDTISRQAIIEKLKEHYNFFVDVYGGFENMPSNIKLRVDEITNCIAEVVNISAVQSEQKTGRWIEQIDTQNDVYYVCSNCKEAFTLIEGTPTDNLYNYCPNCGAYMKGEK